MDSDNINQILGLTHLKGKEDLTDLLVRLRSEFLESGYFTSETILKIELKYWDVVRGRIADLSQYIKSRTGGEATLTSNSELDFDKDCYCMFVHLVWKGGGWS